MSSSNLFADRPDFLAFLRLVYEKKGAWAAVSEIRTHICIDELDDSSPATFSILYPRPEDPEKLEVLKKIP